MLDVWFYTILSVLFVSLISLIGVFTLGVKIARLKTFLIYVVSFATGALFGDAFIHLLPEIVEEYGFTLTVSLSLLGGILLFFIVEKLIHWHHCHIPPEKGHAHSYSYMVLIGDGVHNFIDGLIIAASYLVSIPIGIATTIAVILHEIPQEIGDFGILVHGGFSKAKALMFNFASGLLSIVGATVALLGSAYIENIELFLVPIAAGGFIYIAGSDLIPEINKNFELKKSILQIIAFVVGIAAMAALLLLE